MPRRGKHKDKKEFIMGFRINTNIGAMRAHSYASMTNSNISTSLSHLSSGLRVTTAADDAAGMSIADNLRNQANGLGQAIRNGNDAVALLQTADGALAEVSNIMDMIKQKSIQAANDTNDTTSRTALKNDIDALIASSNSIIQDTQFNNQNLFGTGAKTFHVGAYNGDTVAATIGSTPAIMATADYVVDSNANAETAITNIDARLTSMNKLRASIGSVQQRIESTVRNISITQVNVKAAESQIRDVDFAAESAEFNKNNILAQSGSYALSQANAVQQNVLRLLQ
jgi:flagellin